MIPRHEATLSTVPNCLNCPWRSRAGWDAGVNNWIFSCQHPKANASLSVVDTGMMKRSPGCPLAHKSILSVSTLNIVRRLQL